MPKMHPQPTSQRSTTDRLLDTLERHWPWLLALAVVLLMLDLLAPILMPFVVSAALAYVGDPLVDRLERLHLSRTVGVAVVFVVFFGLLTLAALLLLPVLIHQVALLLQQVPAWIGWIQQVGLPYLGIHVPANLHLDAAGVARALSQHWNKAGSVAALVASGLGQSTPRLIGFIAQMLLIPVVTFYLLRDWDLLVARLRTLIPPRQLPRVAALATESDTVLSAFIRGQLLVMAALAVIYSTGLSLIGLNAALVIGVGAGMVSFVPYLGFITGLVAATLAMLVQSPQLMPIVWVLVVFGVGQIMESTVLTPNLVGERVGLHPVTVIFALLAGGQLFGFIGVLLALPVSAVLAVLVRHALATWKASALYRGVPRDAPQDEPDAAAAGDQHPADP